MAERERETHLRTARQQCMHTYLPMSSNTYPRDCHFLSLHGFIFLILFILIKIIFDAVESVFASETDHSEHKKMIPNRGVYLISLLFIGKAREKNGFKSNKGENLTEWIFCFAFTDFIPELRYRLCLSPS